MNADCDSITALKNALSDGKITPAEVEQRLSAAIEAEYMKDQPRLGFINACEDLLREISTGGATPFSSRAKEDEAFIRFRTKAVHSGSRAAWVKGCAAAAAVALLTVFGVNHGRIAWMTGESINGGEQYLLTGHEISLEFIQDAIADHQQETRFSTESLEAMIGFLGFVPQLPDASGLDVQRVHYSASFVESFIKLTVNYEIGPEQRKVVFTSTWFTDAEYARFTLEQNTQGNVERIAGKDVYAYTNADMPGYVWSDGLAVHMLLGDMSREDSRRMAEGLLLVDGESAPQPVNPVAAARQEKYCKTHDYQKAADFLGYSPVLPDPDIIGAASVQYEIYLEPDVTLLSVLYRRADESTVVYHIEQYADPEEAYLMIQQNGEGTTERLSGTDVYFSMNYDKAGFTWWDGLTVYHLGGSIDQDTGRKVVRKLLEEMH